MGQFSNAKQSIPDVFVEIMKNDTRREELKRKTVVDFAAYAELYRDKFNLRRGAELLLRWNTDKGNK